ncbi:MAG: HAD family hydrolase, partial [Bdellovibrionales bacterium]|nr:HAD family hydrolase [Bdellovibrionales bacterium]
EVEILSGFIEKEMLSVFPDKEVIDILRSFDDKGLFLYVLSGTPKQELEKQLNKWQISNCFLKVIGSPTDKTEGLKSILEESGLGREELIFVGDATADAKAASSSNVRFVYLPSSAKMTSGEVWKKITGLSDLERYV